MKDLSRYPAGRALGAVLLLISILLLIQLACISMDYDIKVVPKDAESGVLEMVIAYRFTEAYLGAARQANQELAADYVAAGLPPPDTHFPESMQELEEKPDFSDLLGPDYEMISETPTEMVAAGTRPYGSGTELGESVVSTYEDENGWLHYVLVIDLPELADQETLDGLDTMRADGLGTKPEVTPPSDEPAPGGEGMLGFLGLFEEISSEVGEAASLEGWYLERILLESGLPVFAYRIEMPGPIQSHTVDGQPAGTLEAGERVLTLVVDEAFTRQVGPGAHQLELDSVVHACEAECNTGPHWVWDGASDADQCGCVCETGWQPDEHAAGSESGT